MPFRKSMVSSRVFFVSWRWLSVSVMACSAPPLVVEVHDLALEEGDRGGALGLKGLEFLDRVLLLARGHLDVLLHVLLDEAQDPLNPVTLALSPAVGLGPGLRGRGRGLARRLEEGQAVVLIEFVEHGHGLLD